MSAPTPSQKAEYAPHHWTAYAAQYEKSIGVMTRPAASALISLANSLFPFSSPSSSFPTSNTPPSPSPSNLSTNPHSPSPSSSFPHSTVLDPGTGTGIISLLLSSLYPDIQITASDISPGMLATLPLSTHPNITPLLLDACDLGQLPSESYTHILSGFMLQFLPIPHEVLADWVRALKPGGVLGLALWGEGMGHIQAWRRATGTVAATAAAAEGIGRRVGEVEGGRKEEGEERPGKKEGEVGGYIVPKIHDQSAWYSLTETREAMEKAGAGEGWKGEVITVENSVKGTEEVMKWWFEGGNPSTEGLLRHWTDWCRERGVERGMERVRWEMRRVLEEEFEGGRRLANELVVSVGRKGGWVRGMGTGIRRKSEREGGDRG